MTSLAMRRIGAKQQRHEAGRGYAERVLRLAEHLQPTDRLFLEQVYRHGLSIQALAQVVRQPRHRVRRRIARLLRHLRQPRFALAVTYNRWLPPDLRTPVQLVMVEGSTLRDAARSARLTLHVIRIRLAAAAALLEMFHRGQMPNHKFQIASSRPHVFEKTASSAL